MVERMAAMMGAPAPQPARARPPEEIVVADLLDRHGDRLLLAEARGGGADARPKLMVVLDLAPPALAAETARLAAVESVAVDVVDRAMWLAMQRLAASGLLQFAHQSRLLHRASTPADPADGAPVPDHRAAELMAEAQRALRMAKVLAAGGFPEEVPVLLAKVVQTAAGARLAERAELPAGASRASDTDLRRLVGRGEFPATVLAILDASQPSAGPPQPDSLQALVAAAEQILSPARHDADQAGKPSLRAA